MSIAFANPTDGNGPSPGVQTIRIARSLDDLSHAFQLIYDSYHRAGLVGNKPSGTRLTPYHLLPSSEVLVAEVNCKITSTLSMFADDDYGLPMETMYGDTVNKLRDEGFQMAEIGCLADRRASHTRFLDTFIQLGRLLAQIAVSRGIDAILAATHPKHARLYKRVMGFRQIGDLTECPYANGNPAVPLFLRFDDHIGTPLHDRFFQDPWPDDELQPYYWEPETTTHFQRVLGRDLKIEQLACIKGAYHWGMIPGSGLPTAGL